MDNAWIICILQRNRSGKKTGVIKSKYRRRRVGERQIPETVMDCKIWKRTPVKMNYEMSYGNEISGRGYDSGSGRKTEKAGSEDSCHFGAVRITASGKSI